MIDNEDEGVGQVDLVENLRHTEIDIDLWDDDQPETPPESEQEPETTPKLPTAPTNSFADLTQEELLVLKDNLHLYPKHKQIQILEILDVLAERKKAKRRRENLLDFIKYIDLDYKVGRHHKKLAVLLEDMAFGRKDRVMVNIAPRHGKLVADETPVLTPGGWTTHGELKVGDYVFGINGHPIEVVAVSAKGPANFKIAFGVGDETEEIYCHENHEWAVYTNKNPTKRVVETNELLTNHEFLFDTTYTDWVMVPGSTVCCIPPRDIISVSNITNSDKIGHCIQVDSPDGLYLVGKTLIPTHNSQLTSIYFPAWYIGNFPKKNIMMVSHTSDLAVEFGRKVRNIVDSDAFKEVFPGVELAADSKASGRWATNHGGSYFAVGVGGALAGRGADLLCIALNSKVFSKERGEVRADSVMLGEHLLGFGGFNKVEKIFHSHSTEEVEIDGAVMTPNHPVWTFNRGWVRAVDICAGDVLDAMSVWDKLAIYLQLKRTNRKNLRRKDNIYGAAQQQTSDYSKLRKVGAALAGKSRLSGWLLGAKKAVRISRRCGSSTPYINFQVSDSNTFYCNALMTHNCIDDPHNEQEVLSGNYEVFERAYDWYAYGARTRLSPSGVVALVMCIAEGQRVLTYNRGWQPIQDVLVGEKVWSFDTDKKITVAKEVKAVIPQGKDTIFSVVANGLEIKANARHPFLVRNESGYNWVKLEDLVPGDLLVTSKSVRSTTRLYGRPWGKNTLPSEFLFLFGYLFGDGWLISNKGKYVGVAVAASAHTELDERVVGLLQKYALSGNVKKTKYGYYRLDSESTAAALLGLGFFGNAKTKRIPEKVFNLRRTEQEAFMRGFLCADGWVRPAERTKEFKKVDYSFLGGLRSKYNKKGKLPPETWTVGICNKDLLEDLKLLAYTAGFSPSKIYTQHLTGVQPPNSPIPIDSVIYSARFNFDYFKQKNKTFSRNLQTEGGYDIRLIKVESITPCGEAEVYDLTVEGTENFICEGFVVHNTRWAENDLTGKLIQDMTRNPGSDQWEVVEFPAILDVEEEVKDENGISNGYTRIVQKSLWPEQWTLESLLRTKASMPPFQWSAQYMQQPTSKDSAIVKREWWQKWEAEEPPACEYVIMSLDAAAEKNNRSDYTSLSTWGVFYKENDEGTTVANIILLNAIKARWEFPELKRRAYQEYREWKPDWFLVEKKSAGVALYQEMRAAGIPVQEVTPTRYSGDKVARLNSVCDIFSSGLVWYPAGRRWAEDLVDEVCGFPAMPQDDQVDTCVYSLMRFRSGGFITLPTDRYDEDEPEFRPRRPAYY